MAQPAITPAIPVAVPSGPTLPGLRFEIQAPATEVSAAAYRHRRLHGADPARAGRRRGQNRRLAPIPVALRRLRTGCGHALWRARLFRERRRSRLCDPPAGPGRRSEAGRGLGAVAGGGGRSRDQGLGGRRAVGRELRGRQLQDRSHLAGQLGEWNAVELPLPLARAGRKAGSRYRRAAAPRRCRISDGAAARRSGRGG